MSIFDVARYLSYSKSVDHFDGTIKSFDLHKADCKRSLNDIFEKKTLNNSKHFQLARK